MRPSLAVLPLMILIASSVYAQCAQTPSAYVIRGRVIAPGERWDRYHEVLQFDEARLVTWAYTDSTGQFSLPGQPPGNYYITVKIDGFKENKERIRVEGCIGVIYHFAYLEFDDELVLRPVILDFTGEVNETVDVAELKRSFPKKAVDEFERARGERLQGEADRALTRLEKLVKEYPDFYDARNALGSVYLEAKRYRDAETQYNEARRLKPSSAAPFVSLGSLYVQEAEASLNAEPEVGGAIVVPAADLGIILSDAREVLTEAIKIKPDASFAYYLMGIVDTRVGNYPKAEENLRKALEIEPKLRWSRLALGNLFIRQGKLKEAIAEYDTYLADYKNVSNRPDVEGARARIAQQLAQETK
ncbi:MAG TPA: tetratricopeptide repeat protein [Terriglobia bacterium]|nr:tetratricopeptide repeat protein [Terriglobia bacterium]